MSRKLYVGNLPYQTDETALESLFAQAGAVESVSVVRDQATGRATGSVTGSLATILWLIALRRSRL